MDVQSKRPGSITFLLVGIVLLTTAGFLFVMFVPVARCPWFIYYSVNPGEECPMGCWKERIPLLKKWREPSVLPEEWEGKQVSQVELLGFVTASCHAAIGSYEIHVGDEMRKRKQHLALYYLWESGLYKSAYIRVVEDNMNPGKVRVSIQVSER